MGPSAGAGEHAQPSPALMTLAPLPSQVPAIYLSIPALDLGEQHSLSLQSRGPEKLQLRGQGLA